MKSRKFLAIALAALTMGTMTAFASCGGNDSASGGTSGNSSSGSTSSGSTSATVSGTVTVTGSTSVQPLMEVLAEEFQKTYKNITINVSGGGSGQGVSDAQSGSVDFGMASRDLKASEKGVKAEKIATDGIAIVVNPSCALDNVTGEQIYNLYTAGTAIGSVTIPVTREDGSGTRSAFYELVENDAGTALEDAETSCSTMVTQQSTGAVITLISNASNTNYLGYISLGSLTEDVKAVKYNGVEASVTNIEAGTYRLARPFNIILKDGKTLSEAAQLFHDYIFSAAGQAIVQSEGCIKVA